jgi:hypothetical protein
VFPFLPPPSPFKWIRLSQLSSIAGALKEGATPRYLLRVLTLPKWRGRVRRAALKIL